MFSSSLTILGLCAYLVATLFLILGMTLSWSDRGNHSALPLGALFLIGALICVSSLGELVSVTYSQATSWTYVLAALVAVVPVTWYVTSASMIGNPRVLRGWWLVIACVVPLVTLLIISMPAFQSLYWQSRTYVGATGLLVAHHHYGWWAWVQFGYSALLTFLGIRLWYRAWHHDNPPAIRLGLGLAFAVLVFLFVALLGRLSVAGENAVFLMGVGAVLAAMGALYGVVDSLAPGVVTASRVAVVDATSMIIVALDTRGCVRDMNPAAERFWKRHLRDCIGASVEALFESSMCPLEPVFKKDEDVRCVTEWRGHPGSFFEVASQPMTGRRGRALGRLLTITDVTARVKAETEIRRSRSWYRAILQHAPSMIMVLDRDGHVQLINQAPEGREIDDVVGESIYDMVSEEHAEQLRAAIERVFAKGCNASYEHQGSEDGAWHTNTVAPIVENGQVIQATLVGTDITSQIESQQALMESEQRYRAIFQTAGTGLLIIDDDTTVVMANQLVSEITGKPLDDIVGRPFTELVAPFERERMIGYHRDRRRVEGSAPAMYECIMQRSDGQKRTAFVNVSIIPGTRQSVASFLDVSEQRDTEERLRHALKLEAIGQLAGGVAHDFNNLLTVINGSAEFVLDELDCSDPARVDVQEILRAGQRAAELTSQLLAFSRRQVLEMSTLNPNQVLTGVSEMLRRLIGEHISLELTLAPDLWDVRSDAAQLEQVIVNLCANARDALPDGGSIRLTTANRELRREMTMSNVSISPGKYVVLSVEDTGTGMSQEVMEHLFEPFFTTKEVGKGTGLGLSSAYGVITQSGGTILCRSKVGEGTTFDIYMRAAEIVEDSPPDSALGEQVPSCGATVLVVEDQEDVRRLTVRMLESNGFHVLEARDGLDALDVGAAYGGDIDVVLTDVVMPQMQGREMIARLKRARDGFAVIYASGYSDQVEEVRAQASRDDDCFLSKPYTVSQLLAVIQQALEKR